MNLWNKFMMTMLLLSAAAPARAQGNELEALKLNLNKEGTHFIQATLLNQVWLRYNQSQPGTLMQGMAANHTFDIGLRRTRFQLFGQLNDRVFVYFQFGQNNFNAQAQYAGSRKVAAFFHDAVCEYKAFKGNQLKLGSGLTIANGLSRFSQPSIGSIMTMDVPVFAQTTVDQTDQFSRKLSVYARGQLHHLDYRFSLSDPFPISSNGLSLPDLSSHATFAQKGRHAQLQGYLMWQFLEHESHTTPYMTGTYLGKKKVFNLAAGAIHQRNAMWRSNGADTIYEDMNLFCVESYLDIPLKRSKGSALSAYAGLFFTLYGKDYLRFNGIMNPASGTALSGLAKDAGPQFGNAYPMFGCGKVLYAQTGWLLPEQIHAGKGRFMPYAAATLARFDRLGIPCNTYNLGMNCLLEGHKAKISLDYQNRPGFLVYADGHQTSGARKNAYTLQYQIFF